ncbi:MAG: MgtC/SapB family protein [Betaproteobacteria bacterium]
MPTAPSPASVALLLGLSFFLGLAFEDFFSQSPRRRPGGIRTFPMLALAGGVLYLLDTSRFLPFTAGLLVLGGWLIVYYRAYVGAADEQGEPNVGIVVPVLNIHAYLLGAVALALPPWIAVTMTVVAVLLLTGREQLHALARRVEIKEIVTAGQFLVLTGIVLPLLPNQPVTTLTPITPRQVWLALVVVCTFSYVSYLAQRYWAPAAGGLWMAALGGLYSSTATTVVLARQAKAQPALRRQAQAGITLATAIMYLRILAIVAIFNLSLARALLLPICALSVAGFIFCAVQYRWRAGPEKQSVQAMHLTAGGNPLELGAAAIFALLFVAVSLATVLVKSQLGISGIYALAAIVGVSDIDPFVLNLAQGGVAGVENAALAAAILIAASSNNILKAAYAAGFAGGKATAASAVVLVALAIAGCAAAYALMLQ